MLKELMVLKHDFFLNMPNPDYKNYSWVMSERMLEKILEDITLQYDIHERPYLLGLPLSVLADMQEDTVGIIKVWQFREISTKKVTK